MSASDALWWMSRLGGIATAIAALELLVAHRALSERGVFAYSVLRLPLPLTYPVTLAVLVAQLASAIATPFVAHAAWIAFATTLLVAMRFRGSFNGGSDSMLLVVQLSLGLATIDARIGLGYCAAHVVLSYVLAGIAKLRDPAWRSGRALALLVALPQYRVPRGIAAIVVAIGRPATYAILAFELAMPVAFAHPTAAWIVVGVGAAFHAGNAFAFGLDRFLYAWIAAYPALLYWTL